MRSSSRCDFAPLVHVSCGCELLPGTKPYVVSEDVLDKSKDEDTSTRTKVFKVVVNENTPRERTFVLAAALTEHVDEADEWVEAILAVTPNARLGEDRTADDNESTWRKRKKLEDPYQVRISVAPAGEAVEVQPEEVRLPHYDVITM